MAWWILLILFYIMAVVLFHIYMRYFSSKRHNFQSKYPPVVIEPWYCPFLGPVLAFLDARASINKWRAKYGDNFTVYIFGQYLTFITKNLDLKKYYNATEQKLSLTRAADTLLHSVYPENQYIVEPSATPYLQTIMAPSYLPYMASNIEIVLNNYLNPKNGTFWEDNGDEVKVDIFEFMYRLTLRMNSINFMSPRVYNHHLSEVIKLFTILDVEKNVVTPSINNFKARLGFKSDKDVAWEQWIQLMTPDVDRCLKMIENHIEPSDFDIAYELVKFSKEELDKRGEPFTPRLVGFLTYSTFLPAQVNTYTTAAFTILEYIRHKDDQIGHRIMEEIEHAPPIGHLTSEYLNSMKFIQACIYEVIRVRTDSPLSIRHAGEDVPLTNDKHIPTGNLVLTPLHGNCDFYRDPHIFDPERHLPPREENKGDLYRAVPFGRGSHPCTGERYVKMQIKVLLIHLLKMCNLEIMKESIDFEKTINRKQLAGLSRPKKPVFIKISKKQSQT